MNDGQKCAYCSYDLSGLGLPGRLFPCPECGRDNRIGHVDSDLVKRPMPGWLELSIRLGWPMAVWGLPTAVSILGNFGTLLALMAWTAPALLALAIARACLWAVECSVPVRRSGALAACITWAVLGSFVLGAASCGLTIGAVAAVAAIANFTG